jgi:hypothetical protein
MPCVNLQRADQTTNGLKEIPQGAIQGHALAPFELGRSKRNTQLEKGHW